MPPFIAIFFSKEGVPQVAGMYTVAEFNARISYLNANIAWAKIIDSRSGKTIDTYYQPKETEEKRA